MSRNKRISRGKIINPSFFVFCEGQTEELYICHLRSKYRLPIMVDAKIAGNRITEGYIKNYKRNKETHPKDKTYLVYDLDVAEMLGKLQAIKNVKLLCSKPCFELWYLLHFQELKSEITSEGCFNKLQDHLQIYKKGVMGNKLKEKLEEKQAKAVNRASKLVAFNNPSSLVYVLINDMEEVKKQKTQI